MKHQIHPHRRAIAMLLAAVALPATPLLAQDIQPLPVPVQTAPTPRVAPPPVVSVAPPATPQTAPAPAPAQPLQTVQTLPTVTEPEPQAPAATAPAQRRSAERAAPQSRARPAQPAASSAPVAAAPALTPQPIAPAVAPVAEPVAPLPAEPVAAEPAAPAPAPGNNAPWLWLVAGLAVIAAIAGLLAWRRRRAAEEYYDEVHDEPVHQPAFEPVAEPVPHAMVAAAPIVPVAAIHVPAAPRHDVVTAQAAPADSVAEAENVSVSEADSADVDAMVASSAAPAGRPWLELMMRPMRAGTNRDDAIVEFELTVGNAGDVPAKDVRISTWMFAAGSAQESEMERMLIEPPADATVSEVTIAPGDGMRIEAAIALRTAQGANGSVLPVLVADARYTLADGSEGRTSASFEIGLARGDEIEGFSTARPTGMHEDVDARLHAEPQHA